MAGALEKSCNLYFIQLAEQMTPEFFYDYFQALAWLSKPASTCRPNPPAFRRIRRIWSFFFPTCILPPSDRPRSLPPSRWRPAVSAVVNARYLVTPYVVDHVTDDAGNITSQTQPTIRRQVISEEVSEQMRAFMENNVGNGQAGYSCRNVYVAGYSIGGKSGTARTA